MQIKLYRSATLSIKRDNFKILVDPWLTDGEYYGSWSHYPYFNLDKNLDEINSHNAIYISHIHPDHCSDETLKKINKNIPVYIHYFHSKFLKAKIERLGFKVFELENAKRHQLSDSCYINIIAADNCNSEICYKHYGCISKTSNGGSQQVDTMSIISDGESTIVNTNDCPYVLTKSSIQEIKKQYNKIDVLLTGYQTATSYPQNCENFTKLEKLKESKRIRNQYLNYALNFIKDLKPSFFLPIAGTYCLSGKLHSLDYIKSRTHIDEAYEFLEKKQNFSKPIKINAEDTFDIKTKLSSKNYVRLDIKKYEDYVKTNLSKYKFTFENDKDPTLLEIKELMNKSHTRYLDMCLKLNIKSSSDIFIKFKNKNFKIGKDKKLLMIDHDNLSTISKKYVAINVDARLLKRLLLGPKYAHWANAEIGSHLKFFRRPNVFDRSVLYSMNFFHS